MFLTSFKFVTALACAPRLPLRPPPTAGDSRLAPPPSLFLLSSLLFCRFPINKAHSKRMARMKEPGVVLYPFTVSVGDSLWPCWLQWRVERVGELNPPPRKRFTSCNLEAFGFYCHLIVSDSKNSGIGRYSDEIHYCHLERTLCWVLFFFALRYLWFVLGKSKHEDILWFVEVNRKCILQDAKQKVVFQNI